ncbi:hypothetical protein C8R46DRAFT_1113729 [Mycena filopes]|nr:hypothetical protein C8R46DRAFT_1113729 [Mycena filopes]
MDALRGMFFASAGFLFASFGFMLSVLSTLLRLFLPYHPTGAEVASTIRRRRTIKKGSSHRRRQTTSSTTTYSTISSHASASSAGSSSTQESEVDLRKPRSLERRTSRVVSEERPEFRNTVVLRRRRSESTPPSPSPWDISHSDAKRSADDTLVTTKRPSSFHLPRAASFDFSLDNAPAGLAFLHRRKSKGPSALGASPAIGPASLPVVDKKKSQLFGLGLRRRSQHEGDALKRLSQISMSPSSAEEEALSSSSPETQLYDVPAPRRVPPKRSQTMRTQPYEAPYFFPTPGSAEAESYYLPPRRQLAPLVAVR